MPFFSYRKRRPRRTRPQRLQRFHFSKTHPGKYRTMSQSLLSNQSRSKFISDRQYHGNIYGWGPESGVNYDSDRASRNMSRAHAYKSLGTGMALAAGHPNSRARMRSVAATIAAEAGGATAAYTLARRLGFSNYQLAGFLGQAIRAQFARRFRR